MGYICFIVPIPVFDFTLSGMAHGLAMLGQALGESRANQVRGGRDAVVKALLVDRVHQTLQAPPSKFV